jgi:hypothetical protein
VRKGEEYSARPNVPLLLLLDDFLRSVRAGITRPEARKAIADASGARPDFIHVKRKILV